jgi:hypothetical protein
MVEGGGRALGSREYPSVTRLTARATSPSKLGEDFIGLSNRLRANSRSPIQILPSLLAEGDRRREAAGVEGFAARAA